jgi:hypothetical protein
MYFQLRGFPAAILGGFFSAAARSTGVLGADRAGGFGRFSATPTVFQRMRLPDVPDERLRGREGLPAR